jgi:hypothetical protein
VSAVKSSPPLGTWLVMGVVLASVTVTPSASSRCGSPELKVGNGVRGSGNEYVVYKTQIVSIRGTGWMSCTREVGGCISPRRPAPASGIDVELVRARSRANAPPEEWQPSRRSFAIATADAQDDYTFAVDQVTMPLNHGHFILMASWSEQPEPQTFAYVTVL